MNAAAIRLDFLHPRLSLVSAVSSKSNALGVDSGGVNEAGNFVSKRIKKQVEGKTKLPDDYEEVSTVLDEYGRKPVVRAALLLDKAERDLSRVAFGKDGEDLEKRATQALNGIIAALAAGDKDTLNTMADAATKYIDNFDLHCRPARIRGPFTNRYLERHFHNYVLPTRDKFLRELEQDVQNTCDLRGGEQFARWLADTSNQTGALWIGRIYRHLPIFKLKRSISRDELAREIVLEAKRLLRLGKYSSVEFVRSVCVAILKAAHGKQHPDAKKSYRDLAKDWTKPLRNRP